MFTHMTHLALNFAGCEVLTSVEDLAIPIRKMRQLQVLDLCFHGSSRMKRVDKMSKALNSLSYPSMEVLHLDFSWNCVMKVSDLPSLSKMPKISCVFPFR